MSMRRPHVGQRIFTALREGNDVVDDEAHRVFPVGVPVDLTAADVAVRAGAGDAGAGLVAGSGRTLGAHVKPPHTSR